MNRPKFLVIVALTLVSVGVWFFAIKQIHTQAQASYWYGQLENTPDTRVQSVIDQIAEMDQVGVIVLVKALGSNRIQVAQAAKQELLDRLLLWRTLSPDEYSRRLMLLAETLAGQVESFGPAARKNATAVAERILSKPLDGRIIDAGKILAINEKIIRAGLDVKFEHTGNRQNEFTDSDFSDIAIAIAESDMALSDAAQKYDANVLDIAASSSKPESADKTDAANSSITSLSDTDEAGSADSEANQPRRLDGSEASGPLKLLNEPSRASRISDRDEPLSAKGRNTPSEMQALTSIHVRSTSHIDPKTSGEPSSIYAARDNVDLMRELNGVNGSADSAIAEELVRRGFSAVQIELARRFFDPDPAVRIQLVNDLPNAQGVDATPWLLELSRDKDAEVRLAAMTMLATSSNPSVLIEIERIAAHDTDFRIRRIAERIEQQRIDKR